MPKAFSLLCLVFAALNGSQSYGEQRTDALSAEIDTLVTGKLSAWNGHGYSDRHVQEMRKRLQRISFPAADGTVTRSLKIADPCFATTIRECGVSLLDLDVHGETGRTLTHEVLQLNSSLELVVVRLTVFRDQGNPETREISAEIRRILQDR